MLVVEHSGGTVSGSGFFFGVLSPGDGIDKPQWRTVERIWVVSNKYVLCPGDPNSPHLPRSVTIHTREVKENKIDWLPITYSWDRVRELIRLHPNPDVDVAAIEVTADLREFLHENRPLAFSLVSDSQFPGKHKILLGVGSDVLVIGYPKGFYDLLNKFPIVKTGVIASRWLSPFEGKRYCLIDAKLFPGSSGSLVISKPTHTTVYEGQLLFSKDIQFCIVGIYSGEPYKTGPPLETEEAILIKKEFCDLGIVWYPDTISETVHQPKSPFADAS